MIRQNTPRRGKRKSCAVSAVASAAPRCDRNERIIEMRKANPTWPAARLARELGLTRNTVIGVLHWAGLTSKAKRVEIARREPRGCRYIHGHPDQPHWHYCQAKQRPGSSYCETHHLICHRPIEEPAGDALEAA